MNLKFYYNRSVLLRFLHAHTAQSGVAARRKLTPIILIHIVVGCRTVRYANAYSIGELLGYFS